MSDAQPLVVIGRFGSPHGVKGWIKLNSFAKPLENILNYQPWQMQTNTGWQEIQYVDSEHHHKGLVVKLAGCDDRDKAQLYTNASIAVHRDQLPALPKGEYYWSDLEGLTVTNLEGLELGKVDYFLETGANDVIVISGEQQHLIPYITGTYVQNIDLAAGKMLVDWNPNF